MLVAYSALFVRFLDPRPLVSHPSIVASDCGGRGPLTSRRPLAALATRCGTRGTQCSKQMSIGRRVFRLGVLQRLSKEKATSGAHVWEASLLEVCMAHSHGCRTKMDHFGPCCFDQIGCLDHFGPYWSSTSCGSIAATAYYYDLDYYYYYCRIPMQTQ